MCLWDDPPLPVLHLNWPVLVVIVDVSAATEREQCRARAEKATRTRGAAAAAATTHLTAHRAGLVPVASGRHGH